MPSTDTVFAVPFVVMLCITVLVFGDVFRGPGEKEQID